MEQPKFKTTPKAHELGTGRQETWHPGEHPETCSADVTLRAPSKMGGD